ncbi:hypothetical protein B14911_03474 [Bacillus sp. NRRL B-14911]|uniref:Uncharacterized protein n=1 Tax=Bacillus infantis NRRL B-14911 TaxID=1367477 RepID=U5LIE5_9BACI|nr:MULTISPECIES: hypothetical protein [Bacillus]AGX06461.1 hypothetical protein N288_23110 [Bacillus infantis NRRL B-14911]EAR68611.1 hypothetical protein B14911_03474 [Bacillus sp. NRRL B-14911]
MEYVRGIALADGEKVIRQYEATTLDNPKTEGYIIATDRRLIFSGEAKGLKGQSMIVKDVKMDHVTGVHAFIGGGNNFSQIVLIAVFTIVTLILGSLLPVFYLGLLFPAFIVYKLIKNPLKTSMMSMIIMADNQTPSSISISAAAQSGSIISALFSKQGFDGNHAWMSVSAAPGKDTLAMIKEIGALVLDIQAKGEHAAIRWMGSTTKAENSKGSKVVKSLKGQQENASNNVQELRKASSDEEYFN